MGGLDFFAQELLSLHFSISTSNSPGWSTRSGARSPVKKQGSDHTHAHSVRKSPQIPRLTSSDATDINPKCLDPGDPCPLKASGGSCQLYPPSVALPPPPPPTPKSHLIVVDLFVLGESPERCNAILVLNHLIPHRSGAGIPSSSIVLTIEETVAVIPVGVPLAVPVVGS